jgi:hypothetical protein
MWRTAPAKLRAGKEPVVDTTVGPTKNKKGNEGTH